MTVTLAAASDPTGPLVLGGLVVTVGYLAACAVWPFARCWRCGGSGKFRSPSGRAWRRCRRCRGTGRRVRYGRRVWTTLARTREKERRHR
ncbi:MAG: hypothetical protein ACRDMV_25130 [Streptosporangiales bacterium]